MTFFTSCSFSKKLPFCILFLFVSLWLFSLDAAFSVQTVKAQNGKDLTLYTLSYTEGNEVRDPEFGNKNVEFNVSLKAVLAANADKNTALRKINTQLTGLENPTDESIRVLLEKRMQEHYKGWGEHNFQYTVDENINCVFADKKIMSLCFYVTSYLGGAHGSYNTTYENYSLESGQNIGKVGDLVKNPADENLVGLLRQKLLANNGEPLTADDFFEFDKIQLCDNFVPDKTGITFLYNIYDILPYSYGATKVFFSFAELAPFMPSSCPYRYLFK